MEAHLATLANYRRAGVKRPMSPRDEDEYYYNAERAWAKIAMIAAGALPFSSLNPPRTPDSDNAVRPPLTEEAGQWH